MDHLAKYHGNYDTEDPRFKKLLESEANKLGEEKGTASPENKRFSTKVADLSKHDQASSPTSSIDKLAYVRVGYDSRAKKSTIDLPNGTSKVLARALAKTIGLRLGEKEGDKHRTKLAPGGPPYQIRFQARDVTPFYIECFVRLLIEGCRHLGITDEAALVQFLDNCPTIAAGFGDEHLSFEDKAVKIFRRMDDRKKAACVNEALDQKNFAFIEAFVPNHDEAVLSILKGVEDYIASNRSDLAKDRLVILAKLAKNHEGVQRRLLEFLVKNCREFSEAINIVYPYLSNTRKESVESLVESVNANHEDLLEQITKAGLFVGGFHFDDQGQLDPAHAVLAMRLATVWALDPHPDADLAHAIDIIRYVCARADSDEELEKLCSGLVKHVKNSPLPDVNHRYPAIAAALAKFQDKTLLIKKYASELKNKFGYGIQKDNESGKYRLEARDDTKVVKLREYQSLMDVLIFAAKAGEVALVIDSIGLVKSARLSRSVGSNHQAALNFYRIALSWLLDSAPQAVPGLKQAYGKEFRSGIASDIREMVKKSFLQAKLLFDDFEDDTLIDELIQLIPADRREGLAEKPTIDDVLARL